MRINESFKQLIGKNAFSDILGQESTKKQLLSGLIVSRHLIIVGPPGIGKTTLAKNVAKLLPDIIVNDCGFNCSPDNPICPECRLNKTIKTKKIKGHERFVRVQGSPDLTVEDLLGDIDPIKALKFGPLSIEAFTPGKIFKANNGVFFFDEINRAPEKLQNALLEILEERKATLGSYDVDFPADFILIGSMNPEDFAGTEKLSEVFLDRFDIIYMGYPETIEIERDIVKTKSTLLKEVKFPEELLTFSLDFIRKIRLSKDVERAPSVRVTIGIYERAQSNALISGRKEVKMQDIDEALVSVLNHRLRLKPSVKYLITNEEFIKKELKEFMESKESSGDYP